MTNILSFTQLYTCDAWDSLPENNLDLIYSMYLAQLRALGCMYGLCQVTYSHNKIEEAKAPNTQDNHKIFNCVDSINC